MARSALERANRGIGFAIAVELDLSSQQTLKRNLSDIQLNFPSIDVLVNNAGILEEGSLLDARDDSFLYIYVGKC